MAFFLTSCSPDKNKIGEAFATMNQEQLSRFIDRISHDVVSKYRYGRGQNVVHAATINKANPQAVRLAHVSGGDLNHSDNDGRTPLHHAIDANLSDAAKTLIDLGARKDIPNEAGFTAVSFCRIVLKNEPNHETCVIINSN